MQSPMRASRDGRHTSRFTEDLGNELELEEALFANRPRIVRFRSTSEVFVTHDFGDADNKPSSRRKPGERVLPDYTISLKDGSEPGMQHPMMADPPRSAGSRVYLMALLLILALVTLVQSSPLADPALWKWTGIPNGRTTAPDRYLPGRALNRRQQSDPTNWCTRWAMQTALINGTLYSFGGQATQSAGQTQNTWNKDFLTLDLTKSWDVGTPTLQGLPQPSGPPAIAEGYMWHSYTSLFLYGGEYSDSPVTSPSPYALWEYDLHSKSWNQHSNPQTSSGNNSDAGNQPVQQAAEGAGLTISSLGRGYYFGGHQDYLTTSGWSYYTTRVYLKSMVEFTFPGYTNNGVNGIGSTPAGDGGAWRNITQGGLQASDGFTERADGVLIYVPGYGPQGIILGLAGGTNTTFTEMNVIDVYDIASSTWYKQSTRGGPPPIRVNPCAVAASAADGTSTNIYLYGGQNLQPAKAQTQYGDMWILTVPSFTWIQVDDSDGAPPNRAGHACEIWDGQMVVFGGYVGTQISCDYPGIYVFDLSKLTWATSFNALSGADDQSQQASQSGNAQALPGSFGYQVPKVVQSVIGGNEFGGATVTAPAASATAGPLATGTPITYTATISGHIVTETGVSSGPAGSGSGNSGPNIAAIVAGTVAGILFVIACYLGYCVHIYRKQLQLYKAHVAASQRAQLAQAQEKPGPGLFAPKTSSEQPSSYEPSSTNVGSNAHLDVSAAGNGGNGTSVRRQISSASSTANLDYQEPSFMGVLVRPRRSLRIVNRD